MTACAIEEAAECRALRPTPRAALTVGAGRSYAARLAGRGDALFAERWTLDGAEPYAVPLPLGQPEEPDTEVAPLADGRVLVHRRVAGLRSFSLLYPAGPGTGEVPLGSVESAEMRLLPPSPDGTCAYALAPGAGSTAVWLVAGGAFGPERVAVVPGRCSGGVWLDRTGRMLALDRERDGVTKAVVVDLERGGEVTPLLQITQDSNDRLLLADAESGLLMVRSDAAGHDRLGWGVLGSLRPVRFPECLRLPDAAVTPFAIQPGRVLMPESCAVALRIDAAAGSWVGVWRPAGRRLHQLPAPGGWLAGSGLWTREGVLRLPYSTEETACGMARLDPPGDPLQPGPRMSGSTAAQPEYAGGEPYGEAVRPPVRRPVPLQQAPLTGRMAPG
ncbi:hypothetical protein [Streptomyces pacificus]|uniref:Uncharacterized protein n=1 Tax=Streptomyces pacificus TaxID=2705029 RepID=A0A6A0AQ40_9ACTN|nr:hypothetical protein [Streptomyces pacificus]GFH34413.1 hypothetical protein SCWH03_06270 [Streptomyces pacificus]